MLREQLDARTWKNNWRKWRNYHRFDPAACESIWNDIRTGRKEGKTITHVDGYASSIWRRRGHLRQFEAACPRRRKGHP